VARLQHDLLHHSSDLSSPAQVSASGTVRGCSRSRNTLWQSQQPKHPA
jgi:hypothetical protein